MTPLATFTGWLLFFALLLAVGSVVARWILVPLAASASFGRPAAGADPDPRHLRTNLERTATALAWFASILLPVAMALVFHRQLSEFRDPFASLAEDASLLLTGTAWGRTWMIAAGASLALAITMTVGRVGVAPAVAWLVATPLIVGLAAYPAVSGHAAGTEGLRWLTMPADTLHVLAAGAWVGGLAFVLVAEHRWRRGAAPGSVLPVLVPVFSPVAIVSVALLVVTGTLASWIHLDGLSALTTTDYGRLLLAKVVVGLGVGVVGVVNWRLITPRLETPDGPRALRRSALLELVLAQVVLVLTAILVRTSPLGH